MGILKTQSTLTIAVWSSILLHTVGFLGFELAFSYKGESFPKSEPRTVTIVSIGSVSSPVSFPEVEKSIQDKVLEQSFSEISEKEENELQDKIMEKPSFSELVSNSMNTHKQEDEILFTDNAINLNENGDGGLTETQREVVLTTEPIPHISIKPDYPFKARKKGLEGIVVLDIIVSKSGKPLSCDISDSSGHIELDNAARKTVLSAYYQPGTINGEDIVSTLRISIRFQLNES